MKGSVLLANLGGVFGAKAEDHHPSAKPSPAAQ
jgi:hypothetical protein